MRFVAAAETQEFARIQDRGFKMHARKCKPTCGALFSGPHKLQPPGSQAQPLEHVRRQSWVVRKIDDLACTDGSDARSASLSERDQLHRKSPPLQPRWSIEIMSSARRRQP